MKSLTQHIIESLQQKVSMELENSIKTWMKRTKVKETYEEVISSYSLMHDYEYSNEIEIIDYSFYEEFDEILQQLKIDDGKKQKALAKEQQKVNDKLSNDLTQKIKSSNLFKKMYDIVMSRKQEDIKLWNSYVDEFNNLILKTLPQLKNVDKYLQQQFGGLFALISISGGVKNTSFEIDGIGSGGQNFNVLQSQFTSEEWNALTIYLKARQKFYKQTDWTN